jgi:hypothetical protein
LPIIEVFKNLTSEPYEMIVLEDGFLVTVIVRLADSAIAAMKAMEGQDAIDCLGFVQVLWIGYPDGTGEMAFPG